MHVGLLVAACPYERRQLQGEADHMHHIEPWNRVGKLVLQPDVVRVSLRSAAQAENDVAVLIQIGNAQTIGAKFVGILPHWLDEVDDEEAD